MCIRDRGEAGLDYDRMFSTKENQQKCFSDILELAEEMDLPLFLHESDAGRDFIKLMKEDVYKRQEYDCFSFNSGTGSGGHT